MNFKEWLEFNEAKDACYKKVKRRYKKWPSAYSSGALVRCRKVGAKNWGNKRKIKERMVNEMLADKNQYSDAATAAMALIYNGIDASNISNQEIIKNLESLDKKIPDDISPILFAARVKMVAREGILSSDFKEGTFDLEKERGLKGWFDRNNGKGWIDCKSSKKGKLVPCGRKKAGKGTDRKYPACRPNLSACNKKGTKRKKDGKIVSWK